MCFAFCSCFTEYMDIYAEVQSPDPAELINSPFGGRYCGPVPPRRRISLFRAIVLSFYTSKNETTPDIFEGRYSFINECKNFPLQPQHHIIDGLVCLICSRIRGRSTSHRRAMFLRNKLRSEAFRLSSFTHVSRCLSERYVMHISVHRQSWSASSNRVS